MSKPREALFTGSRPPHACHTVSCGSLVRRDAWSARSLKPQALTSSARHQMEGMQEAAGAEQ